MQEGSSGDGPFSREESLWVEFFTSEFETWHPETLPARFRPGARRRRPGLRRPLQVAAVVAVLLLLAALALTGLRHEVSDLVVRMGRPDIAVSPTPLPRDTSSPRALRLPASTPPGV
jgi:hypothetical protein